jgi:hypothetical protein
MPSAGPADGVADAVGFVGGLRAAGLAVPLTSSQAFVEALACLDLSTRASWYWAGRATLVRRESEIALFDLVFARYFDAAEAAEEPPGAHQEPLPVSVRYEDDTDEDPAEPEDSSGEVEQAAWSATEVLTDKDFADYTADELAEASTLMARMVTWGPRRRTRRHVRSRGGRGAIDHRSVVRLAARHDSELVSLPRRRRSTGPRRVVFLLDVSGSMDLYSRALLRFAHAAVIGRRRVEVFSLGTRLTRLTRALHWRDPDRALAALEPEVQDWSGGTRLGDGLHRFNAAWGVPGMARGAVVVLLSDGWERGDVDLLAEEMGRLRRVAHQVVWVNPLKATPGYEPLARGMAAALPFVDHFVEGHSLRSLVDLADVIDDAGLVRRTTMPTTSTAGVGG